MEKISVRRYYCHICAHVWDREKPKPAICPVCGGITCDGCCEQCRGHVCDVCGEPVYLDESVVRDAHSKRHARCKTRAVPRPEYMVAMA